MSLVVCSYPGESTKKTEEFVKCAEREWALSTYHSLQNVLICAQLEHSEQDATLMMDSNAHLQQFTPTSLV